jgi:phage gp29-like protein
MRNLFRVRNRAADRFAVVTTPARLAAAKSWRETYNPLRSLTLSRAVSLMEAAQSGEMADLQWTYRFIEGSDPTALALVERRTGALLQMEWDIELVPKERGGFDPGLAQAQALALRSAYEKIDNLYEAIEHLALASFRAYAHVQIQRDRFGAPQHLEPLNQWNFVRDGMYGDWKWNPEAQLTSFRGLPEDALIERLAPGSWLIRSIERPIDRIALVKYIRGSLCEKDWDAFIEIYGLPGAFVIGPPDVPDNKVAEYQAAGEDVAEGGSGYLPNGSDVKFADAPRGSQPFQARLEWLDRQLVLAGTGGLLTMLSMPQGIGAGSTGAHEEAFRTIARSEARKISELFQRRLDRSILDASGFFGKTAFAYFTICARESTDPGTILDHAAKARSAGLTVDPAEISDKTGYTLSAAPAPEPNLTPSRQDAEAAPDSSLRPPRLRVNPSSANRDTVGADDPRSGRILEAGRLLYAGALQADWAAVAQRLNDLFNRAPGLGAGELDRELRALAADLPALLPQDPQTARVLAAAAALELGPVLEGAHGDAEAAEKKEAGQ